ncbi:MAG TPA: heme-binding protein [Tepidisphaeraceae bacterium]|nr:heme-binding protein [Tepidisphaeraceae bacterium]
MELLEPRKLFNGGPVSPDAADTQRLTRTEVEQILARAGSQARPRQIISVVDREGNILGVYGAVNAKNVSRSAETRDGLRIPAQTLLASVARARTAAYFQSTQNAFTTRTARFIIQDHFPHPVPNTPGGPLYGVQFSSLPGSDVLSGPAISGDPGGIPLYKNGVPVGGIGAAGDGHDIAARQDLLFLSPYAANPQRLVFDGTEESDYDERVALAGALGFMAPEPIRANRIFLDGLRLPFTADQPATRNPWRSLTDLLATGSGTLRNPDSVGIPFFRNSDAPRGSPGTPLFSDTPLPTASFFGVTGQYKNTAMNPADPGDDPEAASNPFGLRSVEVDRNGVALSEAERLTVPDIKRIITRAVAQATITRAAIREPIGVHARVHIAVVDRDGEILGVFRMQDGTNFSFDVAVQKARTAAFFSDDAHAFSTRAVGFLAQSFFPPGIDASLPGPLRELQNQLSLQVDPNGDFLLDAEGKPRNLKPPLRNGMTIFPGGVPLYKNGKLVGAVGISGDGVDQDDIIAFAGSLGYRPPPGIRSDQLSHQEVIRLLRARVRFANDHFALGRVGARLLSRLDYYERNNLEDVQLPYVKFPRNWEV